VYRGVQASLGEVLGWRHLIWALSTAMALDPQPGPGGVFCQKRSTPQRAGCSPPWRGPA